MKISTYLQSYRNTNSSGSVTVWDDLCELVSTVTAGKKDGDYFIRGFCDGTRNNNNMQALDLIIIDGDQLKDNATSCCDPHTAHEVMNAWGLTHIIYTSYSHDPDKNIYKWRLLVPCSNLTTENLRQGTDEIITLLIDAGLPVVGVAESYVDSQPWFFPRAPKGRIKDFYSARYDGDEYVVDSTDKTFKQMANDHKVDFSWETIREQFKGGTLHQGIKSAAGWLVRTTDWSDAQIYDHVSTLVDICPDKMKVKRAKDHEINELIKYCRERAAVDSSQDYDQPEPNDAAVLPGYPKELLNLPHRLGDLQDFVYGRMSYPSRATAGITALATVSAIAQTNITISSRDGLGLNEYYMVLAPTGFGKEDLRKPISQLDELSRDTELVAKYCVGNLEGITGTKIHHAAPASAQGIHQHLEVNRSVFYLSDEFAEWLKQSHKDGSSRQQALGYLMQAYSRAMGTIEPGNAVTQHYAPVKNPRVGILATSTAEALFGTMSREQADSGAYNRWLIFVGDQVLPDKVYDGLVYEPEPKLVLHFAWLNSMAITVMHFSAEAQSVYVQLDQAHAEPVKRTDGLLGGRLGEQAIKLAALIALSDERLTIEPDDLTTAFKIRMGLYYRAAALARHEGSLEGLHHTGEAVQQLSSVFERTHGLYRSALPAHSRKFKRLCITEQKAVVETLISNRVIEVDKNRPSFLQSLSQI